MGVQEAVRYVCPPYYDVVSTAERKAWIAEIRAAPIVQQAIDALQGGTWHELPKDRRLRVAFDKFMAEAAYYLMQHRYDRAEGDELKKIEACADRLQQHLDQHGGGTETPYARFVREFMDSVRESTGLGDARSLLDTAVGSTDPS